LAAEEFANGLGAGGDVALIALANALGTVAAGEAVGHFAPQGVCQRPGSRERPLAGRRFHQQARRYRRESGGIDKVGKIGAAFAGEAQADGFEQFLHAAGGVAFGEEGDGVEVIGRGGMVDDAGAVGHELAVANAADHVGAGTAGGEDGGQAHEVLSNVSLYPGGLRGLRLLLFSSLKRRFTIGAQDAILPHTCIGRFGTFGRLGIWQDLASWYIW